MDKLLRIAAYCKVSSLKEAQELSLEAQIQHDTDKTEACTVGENAGVFSDMVQAGTSMVILTNKETRSWPTNYNHYHCDSKIGCSASQSA